MTRIPTLLRTLWYLRREQWLGQLRRTVARRVRPVRLAGPAPTLRFEVPRVPWLPAPAHAHGGVRELTLIHQRVAFGREIDWDTQAAGPLWAYHLHQFDWARQPGLGAEERAEALQSWVRRHREGTGWQPFPTSLRSFAWLKLLTTPGALPQDAALREGLLGSLGDQLATLERRLERHLLANHYLWNLLALVFAGLALEGSRAEAWLGHESLLRAQLAEQILPDGAHCERCPTYQALLLENILDLVNVLASAPGRGAPGLGALLRDVAARMLGALAVCTHPDGRIALFGDSAFDIAQEPAALRGYAAALGIAEQGPASPGYLRDAGFAKLSAGPFTLIATAAVPGPSYQPGHAHCDALSFELSLGDERVVTDTGVYEYLPGPRRAAARATRSHATVEVEGCEQAELWAAHRIGGRPDVALLRVEAGRRAEAVCAGWATPDVLHRRSFEVTPEAVVLHDQFDRAAARARLFLPLAPGLEPQLEGARARLQLPSGARLVLELPQSATWHVERHPSFPEFGREAPRAVLVGEATNLAEAHWRLALEAEAGTFLANLRC